MFNKLFSVLVLVVFVLISCSKDTATNTDCTGVTPTYTADIAPVFNASCATVGCHSANFPAEGIDLSSYEKSKSNSLNGKVLASIKHQSGVKTMPQGEAKLSDDIIKKVECWIKNGAPQ
jgi:hypothetical protein